MTAAAPVPSDVDLLAAHTAGDPHAFAELVRRHRDRMWAVAIRTLRNHEEAADALQEAFVSAFRSAGRFRAESQVSTWLHRIVMNACFDTLRKRQARPTVALPESEHAEPAHPGDPMAQRETTLLVRAALDELPEEQRLPLVLTEVEGYSIAETAQMLGVAPGTIKSRCARGRMKLAGILGHLRNPEPAETVRVHESKRRHRQGRAG